MSTPTTQNGFLIINKQGLWTDTIFKSEEEAAKYLHDFWLPVCGPEYLEKAQKPKFKVISTEEFREMLELQVHNPLFTDGHIFKEIEAKRKK